jgi:type I restriction-modification system DNA methylase subunit
MTKQEAKQQISKLVEKYQRIVEEGKIKIYNEAQSRNEFIEPLFEFLGWDMRNLATDNEVTTEENVSGGRVDLAFRFNNIPVLFLEAKAMKVDLDEWKWAEQAINYSWNKSVTWAVLTDFERVKVFNAEIPPKSISQNLFIEIKCQDYINRFDQLWLLSKESFKQKLLDKEAEKWGKLTQRKQVGEKLFEDLMSWRVQLTRDLKKQNNLTYEELDEGVQRILDRLIFIRTAEDRKIEPNVLLRILRGGKANLYMQLAKVYRDFDDGFNSILFEPHYCEEWKASDEVISEVINGLYETKDGYRYDFSVISADVLGGMYEHYLSYVQGRKSEDKQRSKRKAQGIYYTPKYIVEYLVKETLGEVLKKTKPKELAKIRVLDPACGSGSFLTAAYDKISETLTKQNPQSLLFGKFDILKKNIFGVDLDVQAVEIAQLNLLLKVLSQKAKLPTLQHNLRSGNSLVSGNAERLEKYFGLDYRRQRPVNFEDEFKEVFDQGGFDVIIGNPPYVSFYSRESHLEQYREQLRYFVDCYEITRNYSDRRLNTVMFFIEKSVSLLKENGYLGFIIDANFLEKPFRSVRKMLIEHGYKIKLSKKLSVFRGVSSDQILLIIEKKRWKGPVEILSVNNQNEDIESRVDAISNSSFISDNVVINKRIIEIRSDTTKLNDVAFISTGVQIGIGGTRSYKGQKIENLFYSAKKETKNHYVNISLKSNDFYRYSPITIKNYIKLDEELAYKINKNVEKCNIAVAKATPFKGKSKLFIRQSAPSIVVTLGDKDEVSEYSAFMLIPRRGHNLYYLLALLNSKFITFYALQENIILTGKKKQPQIRLKGLQCLPVPNVNQSEQEKIAKCAQTMLDLHKGLQAIPANTDKYNSLKREIEKLDREIDETISKLYGLTAEEIKIIDK